MIALLDTDVLLDVALDRAPYVQAAAELLDAFEKRTATAFIAWHSISNFYYLTRPSQGSLETKVLLLDLARFVRVAQTTTESLLYAAGQCLSRRRPPGRAISDEENLAESIGPPLNLEPRGSSASARRS